MVTLRSPRRIGNIPMVRLHTNLGPGTLRLGLVLGAPAPRHEWYIPTHPTDHNSGYQVDFHHIPLPRRPSSADSAVEKH